MTGSNSLHAGNRAPLKFLSSLHVGIEAPFKFLISLNVDIEDPSMFLSSSKPGIVSVVCVFVSLDVES